MTAFVWYELLTTDREAAKAFYGQVCGWTYAGDENYAEIVAADNHRLGGIMTRPAEAAAMPPAWLGYVGIDSVDAAVAKLTGGGGVVHKAPMHLPGVGHFVVVADPQGAPFYLFQGEAETSGPSHAAHHVGWHELYTPDPEAALAFYGTQFGWEPDEKLDIGPAGKYHMFRDAGGDRAIGGMMGLPMPGIPPHWNFYFLVDSVAAAVDRIKAGGGSVRMGPMQVPGGSWILQGVDPQGASFALNSLVA